MTTARPAGLGPPRGPDIVAELQHFSYEDLEAEKIRNLQALNEIKSAIMAAEQRRLQGFTFDADWWRRIYSAAKIRGLRDQAIGLQLGEMKRKAHEVATQARQEKQRARLTRQATYERHFVDSAHDLLPYEMFRSIQQETLRRLASPPPSV